MPRLLGNTLQGEKSLDCDRACSGATGDVVFSGGVLAREVVGYSSPNSVIAWSVFLSVGQAFDDPGGMKQGQILGA